MDEYETSYEIIQLFKNSGKVLVGSTGSTSQYTPWFEQEWSPAPMEKCHVQKPDLFWESLSEPTSIRIWQQWFQALLMLLLQLCSNMFRMWNAGYPGQTTYTLTYVTLHTIQSKSVHILQYMQTILLIPSILVLIDVTLKIWYDTIHNIA